VAGRNVVKEISRLRFSREYEGLVGRRTIDDRHYYYGADKTHRALAGAIRECDVWTVILYGESRAPRKAYRELPKIFRHLPVTGEQLFFIAEARTATVYRGNSLGSGYRFTHGIMAHAFAVLARERNIKTFVLSQGPRGGLRLHMSETLRVHGHELSGNYDVSREEVDRTIPMNIRIYGRIRG
jgi:hypothetical protein